MGKIRKSMLVSLAVLVALCASWFSVPSVFAAATGSATVAVSAASAKPGDQITVTVGFTGSENLPGADITVSFSSDVFDFVGSSPASDCTQNASGNTVKFVFLHSAGTGVTSKTVGTITLRVKTGASAGARGTVSITAAQAADFDANVISLSRGSAAVTVTAPPAVTSKPAVVTSKPPAVTSKPPVVDSSEARLASLTLEGVTLNQPFMSNVTEYSATVPNDVTSIAVTAKATDSNARVTVSGNNNLKVGMNYIVIVVTAPNGSKKQYNIGVTRQSAQEGASSGESESTLASGALSGLADTSSNGESGDISESDGPWSGFSSEWGESGQTSSGMGEEREPVDLSSWAIHAAYIGGMVICVLLGCMLGYTIRGRQEK